MTDKEMKCAKYILGLLMLAGCSRLTQPEGPAIVCQAVAPDQTQSPADEETKGTGVTTTTALRTSGIGLFAWITTDGTPFDGTTSFLQNSSFAYDNGLDLWKGGVYWPFGYWLSFFAYSPYNANVTTGNLRFPSSDYVSGYPRLQYTPEDLAANQVDLCLATPVMDRASTVNSGVVPLTFSHVLTRLCIQARWTGTSARIAEVTANGQTIRILGMEIDNVVGSNKLTYGRTSFLWDSPVPADYNASYTLNIANGTFRDIALPAANTYSTNFWNISDACLYVLPQQLAVGTQLTVTYGIFNSGGSMISQETATFDIGDLQQNLWPAGMVMTYSVTLNLTGQDALEGVITFDCNAGCFVTPGSYDFTNSNAGAFLGGSFKMEDNLAGSYGIDGIGTGGSSAGQFITD